MKSLLKYQFSKFLLVGVLNTIVGLTSVFILFNITGFNYWISTGLGNVIGGGCSYLLNKRYTFHSSSPTKKSIFKFIIINLASYFISYYIGFLLIEMIKDFNLSLDAKIYENLSILIASGIYTIINYIGHKYVTFYEPRKIRM